MSSASPSSDAQGRPAGASWRWPVAFTVTGLFVTLAGVYVFKSCRDLPGEALNRTGQVMKQAGEAASKVAAAFTKGTITTTFTSYATTLTGSEYLQFANLSQTEVFTRRDEASTAFGLVPLPDVIVQATAPVTYTYYLDLNGRWDFRVEDGVIRVVAPIIQFNKPAINASRITYEVKKDSVLRNSAEAMESLKESLTSLSYLKARSNINLVRETGRRQVEMFVETWLAKSFTDGKAYAVKVQFRNELTKDETKRLATPVEGPRVIP